MTSPLAILCYERLLPGSQLVNRLEDLSYRVEVLNDVRQLVSVAEEKKPMVVLLDMVSEQGDAGAMIRQLKEAEETAHIPVLAFATKNNVDGQEAARAAGAGLVASEEAILEQLPSLLDHVLEL